MAHRLLIGKGMITLNLKRIFLALTLLPLFAVAADDCALSDPTLTVQAYTVNPQTERRIAFIIDAAVHRHLHLTLTIHIRQQSM